MDNRARVVAIRAHRATGVEGNLRIDERFRHGPGLRSHVAPVSRTARHGVRRGRARTSPVDNGRHAASGGLASGPKGWAGLRPLEIL